MSSASMSPAAQELSSEAGIRARVRGRVVPGRRWLGGGGDEVAGGMLPIPSLEVEETYGR